MQHVLQDWWSCDVHASALRAVFTAQCSWISRWYSLSKCLAMSPNVCVCGSTCTTWANSMIPCVSVVMYRRANSNSHYVKEPSHIEPVK